MNNAFYGTNANSENLREKSFPWAYSGVLQSKRKTQLSEAALKGIRDIH